ncbi:MAG: hypothetical protein IJ779_08565 [Ruminococcus sp.]|nr:hypothetical protein [Ruminococcus sp.]
MDKQQAVKEYINEETGIIVSKKLLSFIMNPQKLEGLNNIALKEIVIEYAPIYQRFRFMLDGPQERSWLVFFEISLMCRISHKPELEKILGISE